MAWRKTPDERAAERAEQEQRLRRLAQAEEARQAAKHEKRFARSPVGRARAAHAEGRVLFQVHLNLWGDRTDSVPLGPSLDDESDDPNDVLNGIQAEGWDLQHAGFVFVSELERREDRFLTGEQTRVSGRAVGFYVFQRRGLD
jgi:hypothetical protein